MIKIKSNMSNDLITTIVLILGKVKLRIAATERTNQKQNGDA